MMKNITLAELRDMEFKPGEIIRTSGKISPTGTPDTEKGNGIEYQLHIDCSGVNVGELLTSYAEYVERIAWANPTRRKVPAYPDGYRELEQLTASPVVVKLANKGRKASRTASPEQVISSINDLDEVAKLEALLEARKKALKQG